MNDIAFLQSQVIRLEQLLNRPDNTPLAARQLELRLQAARERLQQATLQPGKLFPRVAPNLPRAALFLSGAGSAGTEGIKPSLAGKALEHYEQMFVQQALHDELLAARSAGRKYRPRGAAKPSLLFTGTPRGSFGLEFVPASVGDSVNDGVHAAALTSVADAIIRVVDASPGEFEDALKSVPRGVLKPLQQMLIVLSQHVVELRLAFSDRPSRAVPADKIKAASDRLAKVVQLEERVATGISHGILSDSGRFDFKPDEGDGITGLLAEEMTDEETARIGGLFNQRCKATLEVRITTSITGASTTTYTLIDLQPVASSNGEAAAE